MTPTIAQKLQAFVNICLGRAIVVRWSDTISNDEIGRRTGPLPVGGLIGRRKW